MILPWKFVISFHLLYPENVSLTSLCGMLQQNADATNDNGGDYLK